MPTQEEINAAYEMVFNSEKSIAEDFIEVTNKYISDLNEVASRLPSTPGGGASIILQAINQGRNISAMFPGTLNTLRSVYQIVDPNVQQIAGPVPNANSTV